MTLFDFVTPGGCHSAMCGARDRKPSILRQDFSTFPDGAPQPCQVPYAVCGAISTPLRSPTQPSSQAASKPHTSSHQARGISE